MKKFTTLLIASFAIISINAQKNSITALQSPSNAASFKTSSLFTQHIPATTYNASHGTATKNTISVMPAAGTKNIKVVFKADKISEATVVVLNQEGKKVLSQHVHLSAGKNDIVIKDFTSLNEGTYTVQLTNNNENYISTFILWK